MSVYFIRHRDLIKIGYSGDVEKRVAALMGNIPDSKFLGCLPGDRALEGHLHRTFQRQRSHGEWFETSPELISLIETIALPHFPASKMASAAERLISMDEKFAEDAADALLGGVDELVGGGPRPTKEQIAAMFAPAFGLSNVRFMTILMGEATSVSAAEYTLIMKTPRLASQLMRDEATIAMGPLFAADPPTDRWRGTPSDD